MPTDSAKKKCFHCGLPVPDQLDITVRIDDVEQPMCCYGCQAVAQSIVDTGMSDFYRFRTETPSRPEEIVPEFLSQLHAYDNPLVQRQFVTENDNTDGTGSHDVREVSLILEGIVCAACVWLNEKTLQALPGVLDVNINYATHRARVRWDNQRCQLSSILEAISRIGYMAHPFDPARRQALIEKERKTHLRRLGLSAVFGMQIMILAVAMYSGEWWGMEAGFMTTFRWASLVMCLPLLLFSSDLFFRNAWRDIRNGRVGMDVPVALGMGLAFTASVYHTFTGTGSVYYDSVAMFTFFLLTARYFEMLARKRSAEHTESLLNLTPAVATRVEADDAHTVVAVTELMNGDTVLVKPGENIPVDGIVVRGHSGVNESLITGESFPVTKTAGNKVIGGSTNTENALLIRVEHTGSDTVLASIQRLLEDAQQNKPHIAQLADTIAARFVIVILSIASLVALYWYNAGNAQWLEYTVATLVVTCPCALSLATPAALTAASGQLARLGLLPVNSHVMEALAKTTDFVFDKTGTLTSGRLQLSHTETRSVLDRQQCINIAAALERESEHPIAIAIIAQADDETVQASDITNHSGYGITADIDGERWCIGNLQHVCTQCAIETPAFDDTDDASTHIYLARSTELVAVLQLQDSLRDDAGSMVDQLQSLGKQVHILSGDQQAVTQHVANALNIDHIAAQQKPDDKLAYIDALQQQGRIVAMTGDGINDAPVLAGADVSIAMGSGSDIASAHADMVLISNHIGHIAAGYRLAGRTFSIIKQNLGWAILYNIVAIPAAAAGLIQPWLAAIGMSISSIVVVLNALRLSRS